MTITLASHEETPKSHRFGVTEVVGKRFTTEEAAIIASGPKGDIDVFKTQDAANVLNNRAAKAAALAAACQGTAITLPILQDMFHALA
ncbi:hypothetical protein ACC676_01195 [Rhizobium ruizarguesonis]